jgi:hypothetical protein
MIVLLLLIGYATTVAVIIIAVLEAKRMDRGEASLLSRKKALKNQ